MSKNEIWLEPMPVGVDGEVDGYEIARILPDGIKRAYVEKPWANPKSSAIAALNFGIRTGTVIGVLQARGIPVTMVRPQAWQKFAYAGCPKSIGGKLRSHWAFKREFPTTSAFVGLTSKKPHEGIVEAALIAFYGSGGEYGDLSSI